jgi:hypothetical protein
MKDELQKEWDEKFRLSEVCADLEDLCDGVGFVPYEKIEVYMHQRDQSTRLKTLEEVEKVMEGMKKEYADPFWGESEAEWPFRKQYNQALSDLNNAITKLKGE